MLQKLLKHLPYHFPQPLLAVDDISFHHHLMLQGMLFLNAGKVHLLANSISQYILIALCFDRNNM